MADSKDFRVQILWVVSQLSQRGVDPRKHARSRPMGLNVRWLRHGAFVVGLNEGSSLLLAIKVSKCVAFGKKRMLTVVRDRGLTSHWSTLLELRQTSRPNQQDD